MTCYLETTCRLWWLWLLPVLLPALTGAAVYTLQPPQFDAQTTIWVEKATYLELPDDNRWISPAQAQANLLGELLGTRTFLMRVAEQTELSPYTTTEAGRDYLTEYFAKRLSVAARGSHALNVTFRTPQPALGVAVLGAIVNVFTDEVTTNAREQAKIAYDFYSRQLPDREKELVAANAAVRDFLLANPQAAGAPATGNQLLAQTQFEDLRRTQDLARKRYDDTVGALERIQLQAGASDTARANGFRVIDPPAVPIRPASGRKDLLLPIGLALALALAACIGGVLAVSWLDRTLRSPAEARRRLGLPILGALPHRRGRQQTAARRLALRPALPGADSAA